MSGSTMGSLIQEPVGDGETIMIYMTLPVIATRYLDTTRQWESIGLEKRATAINYIKLGRARLASSLTRVSSVNTHLSERLVLSVCVCVPGYQREAAFCKSDGYAIFMNRPSSTW